MTFTLQIENQYALWVRCRSDLAFRTKKEAKKVAKRLTTDTLAYGMVRVINRRGKVAATYSAGKRIDKQAAGKS